jgi:CMP-N-acetylneuraminic acid synthetase
MMKTIAFIPVRGGSKSIHLKNIKLFNGKPLVYWVLLAASNSHYINEIIVSTDSDEIKAIVENFSFKKTKVLNRNPIYAEDTSSTESAMLEYAVNNDFDNIILLQATSPLTTLNHIDEAFKLYLESSADSLISLVRTHRFFWKIKNNFTTPINYDYTLRPRRQDWDGQLVENGAIYITKRKSLIDSESRISGDIVPYIMPGYTYYEIDEPDDWIILESLHKKYTNYEFDTNSSK